MQHSSIDDDDTDDDPSPAKRQRLQIGVTIPNRRSSSGGEESNGLLSPDEEMLSRSFAAVCSCQATAASPTNNNQHCHFNVTSIERQLQQPFTALPASTSTLTGRLSSAPCSCIRLPPPAASPTLGPLVTIGSSALKRRHPSDGSTTAAASPSSTAHPDRPIVRVKHVMSISGSPPLRSHAHPASVALNSPSSLVVEIDGGGFSPEPMLLEEDDDDDKEEDENLDSPSEHTLNAQQPHSSTASTRSMSPVCAATGSPLSLPSSSQPRSHDDSQEELSEDARMEELDYVQHALIMEGIRALEEESDEREVNFLFEKMSNAQSQSMPYII